MTRLDGWGCYVWLDDGVLSFVPANADGSPAAREEGGTVETIESPAFLAAANAALGTRFTLDDFSGKGMLPCGQLPGKLAQPTEDPYA
jgi:hypothetical protein